MKPGEQRPVGGILVTIAPLTTSDQWLGLGEVAYLYTGAHAPTLGIVHEAVSWAHRQQSLGQTGRQNLYDAEEQAKAAIASLVGVPADEVAFVGDASTAWNLLANGLVWQLGDNIVLNELEHPSVVYPWLRLKPHGLDVRVAPRDKDWRVRPEAIAALCDARTRAIAVSHVAYVNGYRHDIHALSTIAEQAGAHLFVDWSHSLGVLPIDMAACDVGLSASYKWLLGPYGAGIVFWNRNRCPDFRPGGVGWRSIADIFTEDRFEQSPLSPDARRFQLGAPAFGTITGLGAAARTLATIGMEPVTNHALMLTGQAHTALAELGLTVITPPGRHERSGNIAFLHTHGEQVMTELAKHAIYTWGGDGRVRASFHLMCGDHDLDKLNHTLRNLLKTLPPGSSGNG